MFKKILFIGIGTAFLAAPLVSSAATLSDLQAQLQSLLAQIQLQQTGATSGSVSGSTTVSPAMPVMPSCPVLSRSLSIGAHGSDVTALQQYLSAQGFLNVSATGYFGSLTQAAVARWQAQNNITTSGGAGSGIFGPLSRSFMLRICNGANGGATPPNVQSLSANPTNGAAPLIVNFTYSPGTANTGLGGLGDLTINFGDGTSGALSSSGGTCDLEIWGRSGCPASFVSSHTYTAAGTYTATLTSSNCACPLNGVCNCPNIPVLGTVTITVGSTASTGSNFYATPTTGAAPLSVQFTSTGPQGSPIGSTVNFGDGTSGNLGFVPVCSSCNALATVSHTYLSAGTYTATLTGGNCACPANGICNCPNMQVLGSATVTVTGNSNVIPPTTSSTLSVYPASGSAPLGANFWYVLPSGSVDNYTINYGDGTSATPTIGCAVNPLSGTNACPSGLVASHTYTTAGTYTATLTQGNCTCPAGGVCNCPNISVLASATVTVGGSSTNTSNDQQINAPASVTLMQGGIAEVRNDSFYFTLQSLSSSSATIQVTPVGCWNSFPSDTPPQVRCMIAIMPIAPQTLAVGQSYTTGNYSITLTQINNAAATFSVSVFPTAQ